MRVISDEIHAPLCVVTGDFVMVTYERDWDTSNEFPPVYRVAITYDPDIFIDDLGDDDRCRMEQLWRAHPYGGRILHCLESEAIERFLAEPDPERGTLVERFRRRNWARRRAAD